MAYTDKKVDLILNKLTKAEYDKLVLAVKNSYGKQLSTGLSAEEEELQLKAYAERLYSQQTGSYLADDIKNNSSSSFMSGVKKILSFGLTGITGYPVEIELDINAGLPGYDVVGLAETAIKMVSESVEAYVKRDVKLAKSAIARDDIIDDYFIKTKKTIINLIEQKSNDGEYLLDLLMVAKYFERIGDHAVNIAEWVEFSVAGVHKGD